VPRMIYTTGHIYPPFGQCYAKNTYLSRNKKTHQT